MARVPVDLLRDAHHWLILHGRYVCKARTRNAGAASRPSGASIRTRF